MLSDLVKAQDGSVVGGNLFRKLDFWYYFCQSLSGLITNIIYVCGRALEENKGCF